jgi:hypothetical protein
MSPERLTAPVNRQALRGPSAGAWQRHLRVPTLWAAESVPVLASMAVPPLAGLVLTVLALRVRPTIVLTT